MYYIQRNATAGTDDHHALDRVTYTWLLVVDMDTYGVS